MICPIPSGGDRFGKIHGAELALNDSIHICAMEWTAGTFRQIENQPRIVDRSCGIAALHRTN